MLESLATLVCFRLSNIFETRKEDLTQFVVTFQQTELVGKFKAKNTQVSKLIFFTVKFQVGDSFSSRPHHAGEI